MSEFDGKVALVTDTSGIGRARRGSRRALLPPNSRFSQEGLRFVLRAICNKMLQ